MPFDASDVEIVNPRDVVEFAESSTRRFRSSLDWLWLFQFGTVGMTRVAFWPRPDVKSFEDALEEVAHWLEQNAPGHLTPPEEATELIEEVLKEKHPGVTLEQWGNALARESWAQEVEQEALADLDYTEAGYLVSYEWTVDTLMPQSPLFRDLFDKSWKEIVDSGDDEPFSFDPDELLALQKAADAMGVEGPLDD